MMTSGRGNGLSHEHELVTFYRSVLLNPEIQEILDNVQV